jgi:hypothetical protein
MNKALDSASQQVISTASSNISQQQHDELFVVIKAHTPVHGEKNNVKTKTGNNAVIATFCNNDKHLNTTIFIKIYNLCD